MIEVFCYNRARLFGKHLMDTVAGGRSTVENKSLNKLLIKKNKCPGSYQIVFSLNSILF